MKDQTRPYNTDVAMLKIQRKLMTDLMSDTPKSVTCKIDLSDIKKFRKSSWPQYNEAGHYVFAKLYQCESFLKRYTFEDDLYSDKHLRESTLRDFRHSQTQFCLPEVRTPVVQVAFERARDICHAILGEFNQDEFDTLCKWGKRAARGLPAKRAYLDVRVKNLTATEAQLHWFEKFFDDDPIFADCVQRPDAVDSVKHTTVPKSYKALRGIAPDTSFGGFLSQGLGTLLRRRLEDGTPIDLSSAKATHMNLAKQGSRTGKLATIDMSKASDSFVWDHIDYMVPDSWKQILKDVRTPNIIVGGVKMPLTSYMLMGSGHTFPLQTILFYSLSKAVVELMETKGPVRVFGDDIIVPSDASKALIYVLEGLGFTINDDKSFIDGHFRESCGGDYYDGFDVRPAMPQGSFCYGSKRKYCSLLFKSLNALLKRWTVYEIPLTISWIYAELEKCIQHGVPLGIPGVHSETSCLLFELPGFSPVAPEVWTREGITLCKQRILVERSCKRRVIDESAYYWAALQLSTTNEPVEEDVQQESWDTSSRKTIPKGLDKACKYRFESQKGVAPQLIWKVVTRLLPQS